MRSRTNITALAMAGLLVVLPSCAEQSGSVPEVPASELTAQVPELDAIHEVMVPMWHEAWPAQDYEAVRSAVADFEPLLTALNNATLPGILQDKQAEWNEQKQLLLDTYQGLKSAAEAGENEQMMAFAEAFHMNYEGLVGIVRPLDPALDAFHQHLYGLYHYYGPGYDLEKIASVAREMAADLPDLQAVTLPERLAEHQGHWGMVVERMGQHISELISVLEHPSREDVDAAVEAIHNDYGELEGIFGAGEGEAQEHVHD